MFYFFLRVESHQPTSLLTILLNLFHTMQQLDDITILQKEYEIAYC